LLRSQNENNNDDDNDNDKSITTTTTTTTNDDELETLFRLFIDEMSEFDWRQPMALEGSDEPPRVASPPPLAVYSPTGIFVARHSTPDTLQRLLDVFNRSKVPIARQLCVRSSNDDQCAL
jgi:hypothetical protein